jgi:hypothetical protein
VTETKMLREVKARVMPIRTHPVFFEGDRIPAEYAQTLASRIWFVNKDRRVDTSDACEAQDRTVAPPPGLSVLELEGSAPHLDAVIADLNRLFAYHHRNAKAIEFTTRSKGVRALFSCKNPAHARPNYHRLVSTLRRHQPHLVRFIQAHVWAATDSEPRLLDTVSIELMQYQQGSHFPSHIDNVVQTGDEPYPIYAIHVGQRTKRFDLLPVFEKDQPAIRVLAEPGQTVLLNGAARLNYSHAVPAARERAYTILFNFKPTHSMPVDNQVLFPKFIGA